MPLSKLLNDFMKNEPTKDTYYYLLDKKNLKTLYSSGNKELELDFSEIINNNNNSVNCIHEYEDYIYIYDLVEDSGLVNLVLKDISEYKRSNSKYAIQLIIFTIISILLIFILVHFLISILLGRLKEMDSKMMEIEKGNFNVRVNDSGFNEVSRIGKQFNRMSEKLKSVMDTQIEQEKAKRIAELKALHAQINPHFLYNTLENIRMQCEIDGYYKITGSLETLSDMLMYSINWSGQMVELRDEWKSLQDYISIMKMRFGEYLTCETYCDEDLFDYQVPKFILQPMVENCFNHGLEMQEPPWNLLVEAYRKDKILIIKIRDNGVGINKQRLETIRDCINSGKVLPNNKKADSIGIINVSQRIQRLCPEGSNIKIYSTLNKGTTVRIEICIN